MKQYAGLDVSLKEISICVVDVDGAVLVRGTVLTEPVGGLLAPDAYDAAREAAPGWDTRHLENEWRRWCGKEEIEPKHPTKHYVKFCESWFEKRGRP